MFKRRNKRSPWHTMLAWLWPQQGFKRSLIYWWHRMARLPDTTHSIACGVASGAAMSFTPFLGLHILLGWLLAFVTRGNYFAVVIGTIVGNPWTFPIIFTGNYKIGTWVLGIEPIEDLSTLPAIILTAISDVFYYFWGNFMGVPTGSGDVAFPLLKSQELIHTWEAFFKPLLLGSIPPAVLSWIFVYFPLKFLLERYKRRQQERRLSKGVKAQSGAKGKRNE